MAIFRQDCKGGKNIMIDLLENTGTWDGSNLLITRSPYPEVNDG